MAEEEEEEKEEEEGKENEVVDKEPSTDNNNVKKPLKRISVAFKNDSDSDSDCDTQSGEKLNKNVEKTPKEFNVNLDTTGSC